MSNRKANFLSVLTPQLPAPHQKAKAWFKGATQGPPKTFGDLVIEITGITLFAAGVFVLCSLLTYHPNDPSLFSNQAGPASNACGWVGAFVSSILLHSVGLGSFLVPVALILLSASLHDRQDFLRILRNLGSVSVAVLALTIFLSLQWQVTPYAGSLLLTGGTLGTWATHLLVEPFNSLGASIVAGLIFLAAIAYATPINVTRVLSATIRGLLTLTYRSIHFLVNTSLIAMSLALIKLITGLRVGSVWAYQKTKSILQTQYSSLRKWNERRKNAKPDIEDATFEPVVDTQDKTTSRREPFFKGPNSEPEIVIEPERGDEKEELEDEDSDELVDEMDAEGEDDPEEEGVEDDVDEYEYEDEEYEDEEYEDEEEVDTIDVSDLKANGSSSSNGPKILPRQSFDQKKVKKPKQMSSQWQLPTVNFLQKPDTVDHAINHDLLIKNSKILQEKLADFGIDGEITAVRPGPVITLYEFKPGPGIKVSRISALADDLSMALSAESVRILAPLPGKSVVGIEIPSEKRERVWLREFLQTESFYDETHNLPVIMGKDIGGKPILSDLAQMPHLLCAGQTGSGKSVFMNSLICSLLYRFNPTQLRMILVDPKFIEFRSYQEIPHLLLPVVDDPKQAATALKWAVREMDRRYRILAIMGARNLKSYNDKFEKMGPDVVHDLLTSDEVEKVLGNRHGVEDLLEAFEKDSDGSPILGKLPNIVIIIDELADLMMIAKKEVEHSIARIAQKARAAGIHLVIATQRPSTDVITGLIKANLPSRVSFQLASHVDSKTILDRGGAERLLGQGDMLFIPPGTSQLQRLHGAFVDDDEINKVADFLRGQSTPVYRDEILIEDDAEPGKSAGSDADQDALYDEAVSIVRSAGQASASYLQRQLKIGYNRAARMIETMEENGIVGPADGSKSREILVP